MEKGGKGVSPCAFVNKLLLTSFLQSPAPINLKMSFAEGYYGAAMYRLDIYCHNMINTKPIALLGKSETDPGDIKKKNTIRI